MALVSDTTDVVNLSLDKIGQQTIQSIEAPTNVTEKICSRGFPQTLKSLLRSHIWNFAIKRENVTRHPTAPAFGFNDKYPLPNDYVRIVGIGEDDIEYYDDPFAIENGFILLDNGGASPLKLRYVFYNDNPVTWDSSFTDLMVVKLAADLAVPITGDVKIASYYYKLYSDMFAEVASLDSQDTELTVLDSKPAVSSRYRFGFQRDDKSKHPGY